ncbi:MAG: MBL fold metallo-hydrolase, partial [Promethearchaeota archaeon]
VKITCIYNNKALPNTNFKGDYGNAVVIKDDNQLIMYDTGNNGDILIHNLNCANIDPNSINLLILSHGHNDHTRGLVKLLSSRNTRVPLQIIAHPLAIERKKASLKASLLFYILYRELEIGFPKLPDSLLSKIEFNFQEKPFQITPYLSTLGEVSNREEPDGSSSLMVHQVNGKWKKDLLYDDLSLALKTKKGLVLICGCCHSGILNTCAQARSLFPEEKIHGIIGGTHMLMFSKKKIKHVADVLEEKYGLPKLYLNHCTGKKATKYFKKRFGAEIFHDFLAGSVLEFEC